MKPWPLLMRTAPRHEGDEWHCGECGALCQAERFGRERPLLMIECLSISCGRADVIDPEVGVPEAA